MPVTKHELMHRLGACEPNYKKLAELGAEAVPHLVALINGDDVGLAAKATYLASVIQTQEAVSALSTAAASPHDVVRVAAAAGLRNLRGETAEPLAERLLDDPDAGVRKFALRAATRLGLSALEPKVRAIATQDSVQALRHIAADALQLMPRNGRNHLHQ